jgi:hypothetical protein
MYALLARQRVPGAITRPAGPVTPGAPGGAPSHDAA